MTQLGYLFLAIGILLTLLVVFIVSFVLYVKTPAPKGCEDLKASEEKCASCSRSECQFYPQKGDNK